MKSINNLNKDWHDSLTSSFRSFLQPLPSQEHSSLIPFLKNFHPRKSLSLSDPPSQAQQQNPLPQNINHHSLWSNKKIVSKEYNSHRKTFHGGHLNEFVHCFNDYYAKIESKLERSNSSLNFDQILINNPFAKHILDMKTKRGRVQKDYPGFGKYLTESLKKRIQEDYHNNSFFSMNFCQKVIHKKQNPWEKVLLEKIRGGERAKSLQREGEKKKEMIIINKITQTQYPSKEKNQNFLI